MDAEPVAHLVWSVHNPALQRRATVVGQRPSARSTSRASARIPAAKGWYANAFSRTVTLPLTHGVPAQMSWPAEAEYMSTNVVPDRGSCVGLPLAAGDYAEGRRISRGLDRALRQAARRTGTTFVDMYSASAGHDICARTPWVNGNVTVREKALAYHPFASGMRADAREVLRALGR